MATQGQRRSEARNAIRKLRQTYRQADTLGERAERELDRLIKRKTLIGPDELKTLAEQIDAWIRVTESVQRVYALVYQLIAQLPR